MLCPVDVAESVYPARAGEFVLSTITTPAGDTISVTVGRKTARILLCVEGRAVITVPGTDEAVEIDKGRSLFVIGSVDDYTLSGRGVFYQAGGPN